MSLKHAILATLSRKPQSGYEIAKSIEGGIGFFWKASHQQIYKELGTLEALGYLVHKDVEQDDAPAKKVYRLAKSGLKELSRWIVEDTSSALIRDPFLIKIFVGHLVDPKEILEALGQYRQKRVATLERFEAIQRQYFAKPKDLPLEMKFQNLVVKRGISHARNWLEWADEVEEFLESLPTPPS